MDNPEHGGSHGTYINAIATSVTPSGCKPAGPFPGMLLAVGLLVSDAPRNEWRKLLPRHRQIQSGASLGKGSVSVWFYSGTDSLDRSPAPLSQ